MDGGKEGEGKGEGEEGRKEKGLGGKKEDINSQYKE